MTQHVPLQPTAREQSEKFGRRIRLINEITGKATMGTMLSSHHATIVELDDGNYLTDRELRRCTWSFVDPD
ncbi:MAG TPA: hypothetical protein VK978_04665 [Candidatus Saccharimonadales bacterium]|nr:hypothetical protein [Candidatus Saccharimonadales bacterium]